MDTHDDDSPSFLRRKPCPGCPWWRHTHAQDIPGFELELAEQLAGTCEGKPQFDEPMFACHQSMPGQEVVCSGWLAVYGNDSVPARLARAQGRLPHEPFEPDPAWPALHPSYEDMMDKLRGDIDAGRPADEAERAR
jgi:hypothetical protein